MEPTVTKRLHISGLTPSISHQDLSHRFSTFGTIKSLDGLGALDGTGRPRKFAYVTLEATPAKLTRCLNTLSGSTWKGAKLRIGEAKPDFRARIQAEHEKFAEEAGPPCKKARLRYGRYRAIHAKDMSPVTLDAAKRKKTWVVTALGRIYRPLKMRPPRPLPSVTSLRSSLLKKSLKGKGKNIEGRGSSWGRKRVKKPETRARRRKIDMVKYGSEYIKGKFLDIDVPLGVSGSLQELMATPVEASGNDESNDEIMEDGREISGADYQRYEAQGAVAGEVRPIRTEGIRTLMLPPSSAADLTIHSTVSPSGLNLDHETKRSLDLLSSIFDPLTRNGDGDDNWMGRESLASDIDMAQTRLSPMDSRANTIEAEVGVDLEQGGTPASKIPIQTSGGPTKLKDLFAPAETEGAFSILGHLSLEDDLELDEAAPFPITQDTSDTIITAQTVGQQAISFPTTGTSGVKANSRRPQQASQIVLDSSQPLFFPLALLATHPAAARSSLITDRDAKNRPKDLFDTLQEKGWDWRTSGFHRTQTEDEIRLRWEEQKGELTQSWKKRWREAGRIGRRRGKVGGGEDG